MSDANPDETPPPRDDVFHEWELGRALDDYFAALEAGCPVCPELLAALNPEISDHLSSRVGDSKTGIDGDFVGPPAPRLGDFLLIKSIGRGGMGMVFEARQLSLKRPVALKVLPFAASLDSVQLSRFLVEARAAAKLHHAHIVPVHFIGREQGMHFFAMQLIKARTLADLIRELRGGGGTSDLSTRPIWAGASSPTEPMTTENGAAASGSDLGFAIGVGVEPVAAARLGVDHHRRVAELGIQAAEALEHAHRQGVIHRDVKPSNLIIDEHGRLWVADFGLARVSDDSNLTKFGDVLGTLRYMSPEQASGDPSRVDHRTDVYSLGATLYELLTLHPVYEEGDRRGLLNRVAAGEIKRPRLWVRTIPDDLETIVLRALSHEPRERYATAGDLADDLRRFLANRPIQARRPSLWNRAGCWSRRHRPFVGASVVIVFLVLGAGLIIQSLLAGNRAHARASRLAAYVRDVNQASLCVRRDALDEAVALLSRHIPEPGAEDDRTFAWRYLWRLAHVRPRSLDGHAGDVYHLEYSPDGGTFATCGRDGTTRLWNARAGALVRTLRDHEGDVDWVAFSPDGRRLATAGDDGSIRLWDVKGSGSSILVGQGEKEVVSVIFTPDGRGLISGDAAGRIRFWDAATGLPNGSAPSLDARIECLAISPDGRTLAVAAAAPGVRLIDIREPQRAAEFAGLGRARCVSFSHDGRLVAAGDRHGTVMLKAVGDDDPARIRKMVQPADLVFGIEGIAFSPNDRVLAACGKGGHLCLWDVESGRLLKTHRSNRSRLWSVAFSPDGRTLAAAGGEGAVELWDATVAQDRETMIAPVSVHPAFPAVLSEGSLTVVAGDPSSPPLRLTTWDTRANRPAVGRDRELPPSDQVVPSPDGSMAALHRVGAIPPVWLATIAGRPAPPPLAHSPELLRDLAAEGVELVFSADGSQLAARGEDRGLVVWDVATGRAKRVVLDDPPPRALAFSPRGDRLGLVGDDSLRILHLDTGAIDVHPDSRLGPPGPVAFTPDGRKIVVGHAHIKALAVWNLDDRRVGPTVLEVPQAPRVLAVSPDGKTLAFGGLAGKIHLVNLPALAPIAFLDAPRDCPRALRFSADGATLLGLFVPNDGSLIVVTAWTTDPARRSPLAPIDFGGR